MSRSTSEAILEKYNSIRRRPTAGDPKLRITMFHSYQRILEDWLPDRHDIEIMDIACGEGTLLLYLKESGYSHLSGFDFSPENVEIAHRLGLDFVQQADALKIQDLYPGVEFDLVFLMDFLEHVPKQSAVTFLEKITGKMKTGGVLVIQTPNMGSLFGVFHRYNDLTHEFCVTENTMVDLLLAAGFKINRIEIRPAWNATTFLGRLREVYLRLFHFLVSYAEDSNRPKIATKNLLVRVTKT